TTCYSFLLILSFHLPFILLPFFFFTHTAPTHIYTLSLHDALPISLALYLSFFISRKSASTKLYRPPFLITLSVFFWYCLVQERRSEEHTSELQSRVDLVCRLLLEKKKKQLIKKLFVIYS